MTPRAYLWLIAGGAVLRLLYLGEHANSAFFAVALLDATWYDTVARALVEGSDLRGINPGFRPLLYPALLAALRTLTGEIAAVAVFFVQHVLGILTALLCAALATRLFRRPAAGVLAGALYLLAAPPLYFEGELLIASLATFLVALLLWVLARAEDKPEALPWWAAAGILVGLAAQARPNLLLVGALFPLVLAWPQGSVFPATRVDRAARATTALAGMVGMLVLAGILQMPYFGGFQWLGGSGGVNFYLGNKRGADGMIPRQDFPTSYGAEYRDSVQVFAVQAYLQTLRFEGKPVPDPLPPSAVSRFWLGRGVDEIRADPAAWLGLMTRKTLYLTWDREIPNNKNLAFVRAHESTLLRLLPVHWWMLFALAPLGVAAAWHQKGKHAGDRRTLVLVLGAGAIYAAGVVLFFVNSRYRLPLWPLAAALAGGGALQLVDTLRARDVRRALRLGLVAAACAILSLVNWTGAPAESFARDFFFRSVAALEKGWVEQAETDARASVDIDPADAAAWFQLGTAALATEHWSVALESFAEAGARRPDEPRIDNNLGVAYDALRRPADAYRAYLAAISKRDDYPPPLVNAALLELRAGFVELAAARLERARALDFAGVPMRVAEAFVAARRGDEAAARRLLDSAREVDAELVERLVAEQGRRIDPKLLVPSHGDGE